MTLTAEQKSLLLPHVSIMKDNGKEITKNFYNTMFEEHPELRNFFNQTNQKTGKQPIALAQTVYYFAKNLDNLDAMTAQMTHISNKHRAILVKPEHYPIVGKYLLKAIKDFLGDKATPELMAAWQGLYDLIAATFINKEKELYGKLGNNESDKGFVPFNIVKKEQIASGPIYSFKLERQDNGKLFDYFPGQYITLRVEKNGVLHHGHYPLVEPFNGHTYTIAAKPGNDLEQNSVVSEELLHNRGVGSTVLVSAPAGSFKLVSGAKSHLFITGGIGIASIVSLIQELNQQGKAASATLIQCVRTESHAAYVATLQKILPKEQYLILTQEEPISSAHLQGKLDSGTQVYLSGSEVFLAMADNALAGFNVPKAHIHVRSIEPTLRLLKELDTK